MDSRKQPSTQVPGTVSTVLPIATRTSLLQLKLLMDLDQALAHLYTDAHRATFRLLVDAVIGRCHLCQVNESSWSSFVLTG
jgi:hypothetical protein